MDNFQSKTDEELINCCPRGMVDANAAQIEMMRRLKNEIKRFNDTSTALALLLFVIAFLQLLVSLGAISANWQSWSFLIVIVTGIIYFFVKYIEKRIKHKE